MTVIRVKLFTDRKIVSTSLRVGGEWPYIENDKGEWVCKTTGKVVKPMSLDKAIKFCEDSLIEKTN